MPEGDALHRAALRLQVLVGDRIEVEAVHPRARSLAVAERLDGRVLESVEALGKNLLFRFEKGIVLRSHLRMKGSWRILPQAAEVRGLPWLVLRGREHQAVLRGGAVLELTDGGTRRLGPDILARPPDLAGMLMRLRAADPRRELGDALLDQRVVAGIGNIWRAEALWRAQLSPWLRLADATDEELLAVLEEAAGLMRASVAGLRVKRAVYRRAVYRRMGRPCARCGATILRRGQGDGNRTAYWCPGCQRGEAPARK